MHIRLLFCLTTIAVAIGTISAPIEARSAEPRKLRITLQLPLSNHLGQNLLEFKLKLEERSQNRFEVEIFDRAQLYKDFEVIDAVGSGAIEMGVVALNQYRKTVPIVDMYGLPFMFSLPAVLNESLKPEHPIRKRIEDLIIAATPTQPLWWQPYGTTVFFSNGGRGMVSPDDVGGKNTRVISDAEGDFIRLCGGTPFRIPGSKQHQALADGKVEVGITGVSGVKSRSLWKVSDTITKTNHSVIEFLVIINSELWQSLSDADRDLISTAAREAEKSLRDKFASIEDDAYRFAREKGMKIVTVTPNDLAEWRACSVEMLDQFLSRTGDTGFDLMGVYGDLRRDPCCNKGPEGVFTRH